MNEFPYGNYKQKPSPGVWYAQIESKPELYRVRKWQDEDVTLVPMVGGYGLNEAISINGSFVRIIGYVEEAMGN